MLRMINEFDGVSIISFRISDIVANISEPIIQPDGLTIIGFFVNPIRGGDRLVLMNEDVREVSNKGMIIDDAEKLMDLDDLVRIKEVVDLNFMIIGKKVETEKKHKVGKVQNFAIEDKSWLVKKVYVSSSILKDFTSTGRVIDRTQIVDVTDTKIVIKDSDEKVTEKAWATEAPPA